MSDTYYKLPDSHRWLSEMSSNPNCIGGRATDIGQIGYSIRTAIKTIYPINEVPPSIVDQLEELMYFLSTSEAKIDSLIEQVSLDIFYRLLKMGERSFKDGD